MRARGPILRLLGFLVVGALISVLVALTAAALRPTDGWPNILGNGRDTYHEKYKLPQFRFQTPEGEVGVDIFGGSAHTQVMLAPLWKHSLGPEDQGLLTTYPLPDTVPEQTLEAFGNPTRLEVPYWASRWSDAPHETAVMTCAWGWPFRCLRATERSIVYDVFTVSVETQGYYVFSAVNAGTRVRRLPFDVVVPGMLLNAALYALVCWLLVLTLSRFRKSIRRLRGRCPRCAYSRAGLASLTPCPECGHSMCRS